MSTNPDKGISGSLVRLALDEGEVIAIAKGELWRNALEEMAEVGNEEQQKMALALLSYVQAGIELCLL